MSFASTAEAAEEATLSGISMLLWYHPKKEEEERGKLKEFLAAAKQVYT